MHQDPVEEAAEEKGTIRFCWDPDCSICLHETMCHNQRSKRQWGRYWTSIADCICPTSNSKHKPDTKGLLVYSNCSINTYWHYFQASGRTNLIYLFYESVPLNANKMVGEPGDKHFHCYHGNRKILTITCKMRSSLNGIFLYSILSHIPTNHWNNCRFNWSPQSSLPPDASTISCSQRS